MAQQFFPVAMLMMAMLPMILASACRSSERSGMTIVLYAFSAVEDVMKDEIIPAFVDEVKESTGEEIRVVTSFAGSGTITNQIIFGAPAHVAIVATEMDAINLRNAGVVSTDWRSFKNEGTFAYTVTSIVTRQGNPRGLRSFEDLGGQGVQIVYPDPTTSGGAQWAILALYGSALKTSELASGVPDHVAARQLVAAVSANAGSLPESARRALTQFQLGYGNALLTYENEALMDVARGKTYEVIVPRSTILIEPKVVIVDSNVDAEDEDMVRAFVDFLWSEQAQVALARNNFRVWDDAIMEQFAGRYAKVELPFTVEYLGGWEVATSDIIDRVWRDVQRELR